MIFYACPIVAWGDITINYRIKTILSGMVVTEIWVAGSTKTRTLYDPLIEWESIPALKKRQSIELRKLGFAGRDSDMGCSMLFLPFEMDNKRLTSKTSTMFKWFMGSSHDAILQGRQNIYGGEFWGWPSPVWEVGSFSQDWIRMDKGL